MSAIALLRARTAPSHARVDAAFAGDDLSDAAAYGRFLQAHARALPQAEAMAAAVWPVLRRRVPLLQADLEELGMPVSLRVLTDNHAGARQWGALYVVEGSRLGGGLLAKRVGAGFPVRYLSAIHQPGEWRAIRHAIDEVAEGRDAAWTAQMIAGAEATFALYEEAAAA